MVPGWEGICWMQASHSAGGVSVRFDDPNLVSCAGLVPVMRLAERVGLPDLAAQTVKLSPAVGSAGANAGAKVASVVAGMVCGADCIDDLDVLRHGALSRLFTGARAPSTLGTFLRGFTYGHVAQLEKLGSVLLKRLVRQCGMLPGADRLVFIDIDSKIKQVYGPGKQGAVYGYSRVRGLNYLMATISTPQAAPVVAATRMRGGNANSARGADSLITAAIKTARSCGATGRIVVRGDSAYFSGPVIAAIRAAGACFSVTAKHTSTVKAAIAGIDERAWQPVTFTRPAFDEVAGRWITGGEVAETTLEAFTNVTHNPGRKVTARLIVRRTRITSRNATGELFPVWCYHAVFTDSPHPMLTAEAEHRGRAGTIEQVFADLNDSAAAHLPSGQLAANGAWLSLAALTHNLMRAAGCLASQFHAKARTATLRRHLVTIPARIARSARTIVLHTPAGWRWAHAFTDLFTATHAPPPVI
jgi:hypothetical protein